MLQHQRARNRDGRHRSCQAEGRDDRKLACARKVDDAVRHRIVIKPGRVGIDDRCRPDAVLERRGVKPAPEPDHLETLLNLRPTARVNMHRLVAVYQLGPCHRIVAQMGWHVLRLNGRAKDVHHIERLLQPECFEVVTHHARPPPAFAVKGIGTAAAGHEQHRSKGIILLAHRVRGAHSDRFGCAHQRRFNHLAANTHHLGIIIDDGAARLEQLACIGKKEANPQFLENAQGAVVHRCDLIFGKGRLRREGVGQVHIGARVRLASLAAGARCPSTAATSRFCLTHCVPRCCDSGISARALHHAIHGHSCL